MKYYFRAFILLVSLISFCFQSITACSLDIPPLRKEFRNSKLVFLGKITKIEDYYVPTEQEKAYIPKYWKEISAEMKNNKIFSKVTFEIKNEWKGSLPENKEFLSVAYWGCGCPGEIDKFEIKKEYVIFSTEKNFVSVCDSFRQTIMEKPKLIKKLDDFWFRIWARIYPF